MSGSRLGTVLSGVTLIGVLILNVRSPAPLPPLGPFLDPVHGVWSVSRQAELPDSALGRIPGLTASVDVRYDRRGVPHLFARSEEDVVRALGYVVARDRLFQLELQSRAGSGRLAGLVGAAALPMDREMRSLGLPDAARRRLALLSPGERRQLEAFADGANAWIDGLTRRDLPLEYHLLGRRPERWSPINSLHLLSYMGYVLALSDLEDVVGSARQLLGPAVADALYPRNSPIVEPLQPNGQTAPRFSEAVIPPPPEIAMGPVRGGMVAACLRPRPCLPARADDVPTDALGSNNWAVGPKRSATGYPLLAGDQHLELTLPSIWYEVHLSVPDSLDVYGVTIPGAPSVIIGFTRALAWTFTNTESDVFDLYQETVDDSLAPTRYRLDDQWRPLRIEVEDVKGPHGERLARDTLRYTHRGPLRRNHAGGWVSIRWTMLESGSGLGTFARAARAPDARDWLAAMAEYRAPAQNMLVADLAGNIAIRSNGRFPIRPSDRGDLVQAGDSSATDWTGDWAVADAPQSLNPSQGFLASANQQPLDPRVNGRYLGANWYAPWRAMQINKRLRADSAVTPDAMRRIQTDAGNAMADIFVPALLNAASKFPTRDTLRRAALLLAEWDRGYTRENTRAVLYEEAISQLQLLLWDELHRPGAELPRNPGMSITAVLLRDSTNLWWDDRRTRAIVEQRDDILASALTRALAATLSAHGPPEGDAWRWDRIRTANIRHQLRIPALSALKIPIQGGLGSTNPLSDEGNFGASWRMVVEVGPEVHGWGAYPGGQSGNPLSGRYLDRLHSWQEGELDSLRFPRVPAELEREQTSVLKLAPVLR